MANNFSYKRSLATTMKVSGFYDAGRGTIDVDGIDKSILTLLSDFQGAEICITVKTSIDNELDEPSEPASEVDIGDLQP